MNARQKKLWAVQLEQWPNSVRLTARDILHWAANTQRQGEREMRRAVLTSSLVYHPNAVFYITDPAGGHIGARYGIDPCAYVSGFNMRLCTFTNNLICDTEQY